MRTKNLESASFEEAIALEAQRARCSRPLQDRHFSYVARGFYTEQLRRMAEHFPSEQRLVLRMEDMLDPASGAMDRIWDFLGVDRPVGLTQVHANRRAYAAPMASATRQMLAATSPLTTPWWTMGMLAHPIIVSRSLRTMNSASAPQRARITLPWR